MECVFNIPNPSNKNNLKVSLYIEKLIKVDYNPPCSKYYFACFAAFDRTITANNHLGSVWYGVIHLDYW